MEQMWTFSSSAVTVAAVDFLDPDVADGPHPRERGVRLEVRPVRRRHGRLDLRVAGLGRGTGRGSRRPPGVVAARR